MQACVSKSSVWTIARRLRPWNLHLQALRQLQDKMASCTYGHPDDRTLKWFLRDRKLDAEEAAQKLTNMLKWRQDFQ